MTSPTGTIAAGDSQTAAAGAQILTRGGNAVDAAVAAAFASFVAEAPIVNIGGGGIALLVNGETGEAAAYDFFSDMPSGPLSPTIDFHRVTIDFGGAQQDFHIGRASAAVPGAVPGLCALAAERGTLPLATLLEPAIALAAEGAVLSQAMEFPYTVLQPIYRDTPEMAALYLPDGRAVRPGERLRFPALAQTLRLLAAEGPALFRDGAVARAVVADQQAHGGLITAADLRDYAVYRAPPLCERYREFDVLLPPPPSTGGTLIAFSLALLASIEVAALGHNSAAHLQALAETMRLTNRARSEWDTSAPRNGEPRAAHFLDEARLAAYRDELHHCLRDKSLRVDAPQPPAPNHTTHISVIDGAGNAVALTTSAGESAGFVVGETGVVLNNMLGEMDLHPLGFHRAAPGSRLATMMTPTVVRRRGGQPILATGSGGSNRIRSAILQTISNVVDFDLPAPQAVNASRVHFEEGVLQVEGGVSQGATEALDARGYSVNRWVGSNFYFGGAHSVAVKAGRLVGAGDARRGGAVA